MTAKTPQYILAIDQGTTSTRSIVFDHEGAVVATAQQEFSQHYPNNGWVEHDPQEILQTVKATVIESITTAGIAASQIAGIGISNQRETTIVWDRDTGQPVYPAIVWQDRRTAERCQSLKSSEWETQAHRKTGLFIDPYFSATKIDWILSNVEGARAQAEAGELAFGTIDTWLLWHLTNGEQHATDATNASRTLLFNIHDQQWDDELLKLFHVPRNMLPEVRDCADDYGTTQVEWLDANIPIYSLIGDQQAALVGQACFEPGMAKSTYGTGCFLVLNTGETAINSNHQLLTTVAYRLDGKPTYAIEGSIFVAGATIQWLRDGLKLLSTASDSEQLAERSRKDHGVFLVPAFTGLGAPFWDPDARGAISGLTRASSIEDIVAAGLESVCYQTKDLQKAMEQDGLRPELLRVDGGMTTNNWLMQRLADVLGGRIDRPSNVETTAQGAMYLAGLKAGLFRSLEHISEQWRVDQIFEPQITKAERDSQYAGWLDAVERVRVNRD
ncbi:Glycerol kinase [BD1-7 clade bacterium]|uniref:Glycerol kinase n=1 Tax=BD1-7 clade bacterium TaxID=2029982 RepID=A0A5S9N8M0_9GAMM|nr:Glycerol kinase [BD1-7 clade bacterium]